MTVQCIFITVDLVCGEEANVAHTMFLKGYIETAQFDLRFY